MFDRLPRLLLVPHADAGDRSKWTADQDTRPLSELGVAQAAALAEEIGSVDTIISSPARRCLQTVEPIGQRSRVPVHRSEDLREITYVDEINPWDAWNLDTDWRGQLVAAGAIGRCLRVLTALVDEGTQRRVVVSAHGDLIPLLALLVSGYFRRPVPPPIARGGCYVVDPSNPDQPISTLGQLAPPPR